MTSMSILKIDKLRLREIRMSCPVRSQGLLREGGRFRTCLLGGGGVGPRVGWETPKWTERGELL